MVLLFDYSPWLVSLGLVYVPVGEVSVIFDVVLDNDDVYLFYGRFPQ